MRPDEPGRDKKCEDEGIRKQGSEPRFASSPLDQIKQTGPAEKNHCVGMSVKGESEERGHDRDRVGVANGIPSEEDKESRHRLGPGVNRLPNKIWVRDIEKGGG